MKLAENNKLYGQYKTWTADYGPDYMSRAGPVSRAALVRAGPVVM